VYILHAGYVPEMSSVLKRGLLAGAAGTTLLNAVTYLDMALRGRPGSDTPERTVDAGLKKLGRGLPGSSKKQEARRTGLGALSGIGSGLAIGVGASAARAFGVRLPGPIAAVATGAGAMAATNLPMAAAGLTDPREWSATDWVSDAIPHLAYGIGTHAVIAATDETGPAPAASPVLVLKAFGLGLATGMRSSLGAAAPGLFRRDGVSAIGRVVRAGGVGAELVADKLPNTPSRLEGPGLAYRAGAGADGGLLLARRAETASGACLVAGALGAVATSYGGLAWRGWAAKRMPDWQGALIEDGVALGLAFVTCR
jgi:uncharacterized membrane protein